MICLRTLSCQKRWAWWWNLPNGQAGGFLGKAFDPFALMADPSKENFKVPDLLPPASIPVARVDRRRRMRAAVEKSMTEFEASESARVDG